jgi:glutamate-1-semialdehyde 2,1-aminomutase
VMRAGAGMHYSATFHGDTAAMAAALRTLQLVRAEGVQVRIERLGQMLIDGLNDLAAELDAPAIAYGEPLAAMPFFRFTHPRPEMNATLTRSFYREILARGILLHPRHMWFVSNAHREDDIALTLDAARASLKLALRESAR